ncbi:MAG: DUF169 domain-containing protein [Clostridium sp.]
MNKESISKSLSKYLGLERSIVGIKFIFTQDEYDGCKTPEIDGLASYCYLVKEASEGKCYKSCSKTFKCNPSAMALGIRKTNNKVISGQNYYSHGTYESLALAKKVQGDTTYINHEIYGVQVKPIEEYDCNPDIVIMVVNTYQGMRISQGYAYKYGMMKNIKFSGKQAFCSECTATPYENNDINMSLLCSNTRYSCDWKDNEIAIGMPFNKLSGILEGIEKTTTAMELDEKKVQIESRAKNQGQNIDTNIGKNYFNSNNGYLKLDK